MGNLFSRLVATVCLSVLCLGLSALPSRTEVQVPDWYELQSRNLHYPREMWFVGFVIGEPQAGESIAQATERLKRGAQTDAAASIRMKVEKTLTSVNRSEQVQTAGTFDEQVTEMFESATRMEVNMEIPGLRTEVWQNPANKEIAVFACVKKSELVRKLDRQITAGITKQEMAVEHIQTLIQQGNKATARTETEKALDTFVGIEQAQMLLLAIGSAPEDLQLVEIASLRQQLTDLQAALKHGITVCLRVNAVYKEESFAYPEKRIQGELSEVGCNFTSDTIGTDWVIDVIAVPRHYQCTAFGNVNTYTAYVDAHINIIQMSASQCIYKDVLTAKGTHTLGFDEAVRVAYDASITQTSAIIKQYITQ